MILRWPVRARAALAYFFRPLQDLDVYVEDTNDEVFYSELFKSISPSQVRLVRVIAAGDRLSVVERARTHDFGSRAALFLIDGDLEWVRGEPPPDVHGVYRLPAYCIENLLIHEDAAVQVIVEEAAISEEKARAALAFSEWLDQISEPLISLFMSFAVLNAVNPSERTVGLGVGSVIETRKQGGVPELDRRKSEKLRRTIDNKVVALVGEERAKALRAKVLARVGCLPTPVDIVSGKDFLMPLFEHRLRTCTCAPVRRVSLRMRLARRCSRARFQGVTDALAAAAHGTLN